MILQHRPLVAWPGELRKHRKPSPFRATWSETLDLLVREMYMVEARSPVVLQVAVDEREVRLDGQLRADARARHPGVILNFETPRLGAVSIPCDRFEAVSYRSSSGWQVNVRAIALGLEALRKIDRYGIAPRGEQYTGWKALPSGIALGAAPMTIEQAAELLVDEGEWGGERGDPAALILDHDLAADYYRHAAKRHHPDAGGDPELFRRLTAARDLLVRS